MDNELALEKEKATFYLRFNPNHAADGKFASGGGSGGSGGSSGGNGEGSKEYDYSDFSKSKVKETLYHGSDKDFKEFKLNQGSEGNGTLFFSKEQDYAEALLDEAGGGKMYEVKINTQNPMHVKLPPNQFSDPAVESKFIKDAKQKGHDAVIFENDTDSEYDKATFYSVFSPKQVKIKKKYDYGDEGQFAQTKRNVDMSKKELERRAYDFEITAKNTEKGAIITGRPIVYNSRTNIGLFDEIIENGALAKTDLTDVRFLVNHDVSKIPLARSRRNNGNSTMKLIPDDKGLAIEVELDVENNSEARSLYSAVKRGDISGMSFLFGVPEGGDNWENLNSGHPTRHVRSIGSVVEVSAVTFPAYESTEIYARSEEALESAKLALENAKRSQKQTLESERRSELELEKAKFEALMKVR